MIIPEPNSSDHIYLILYSVFLLLHFTYATYLIYGQKLSLEAAGLSNPKAILTLLLVINGLSITAFFWKNPNWILINVIYHLFLAADEAIRIRKIKPRIPFLVNHLLFAAILYLSTQPTR